ncbi:hypothetical protein SM11_chr1305 [Sinorhizobium meliloti SM11]|uniref:Uncharacterized protein n=1 Tax=Sinorhizobium meliloti (strain SM11) TaxID=707241 RepID=F7X5E2_SINMM|nr:hypothetical protein SM11_chr1305 [Sinorhizobium meliloti SM11]
MRRSVSDECFFRSVGEDATGGGSVRIGVDAEAIAVSGKEKFSRSS